MLLAIAPVALAMPAALAVKRAEGRRGHVVSVAMIASYGEPLPEPPRQRIKRDGVEYIIEGGVDAEQAIPVAQRLAVLCRQRTPRASEWLRVDQATIDQFAEGWVVSYFVDGGEEMFTFEVNTAETEVVARREPVACGLDQEDRMYPIHDLGPRGWHCKRNELMSAGVSKAVYFGAALDLGLCARSLDECRRQPGDTACVARDEAECFEADDGTRQAICVDRQCDAVRQWLGGQPGITYIGPCETVR